MTAEPPERVRLSVELVRGGGEWRPFEPVEPLVETAAGVVAQYLAGPGGPDGRRAVTACIALSSDDEIRRLNREFRGKDSATNVLSFPSPPPPPGTDGADDSLGDVVLAAETVMREAAELGVPLAHHLQHLVVHGLLHLAGYDHETDDEAAEMEDLETRLLGAIGIPDPYARDGEEAPEPRTPRKSRGKHGH